MLPTPLPQAPTCTQAHLDSLWALVLALLADPHPTPPQQPHTPLAPLSDWHLLPLTNGRLAAVGHCNAVLHVPEGDEAWVAQWVADAGGAVLHPVAGTSCVSLVESAGAGAMPLQVAALRVLAAANACGKGLSFDRGVHMLRWMADAAAALSQPDLVQHMRLLHVFPVVGSDTLHHANGKAAVHGDALVRVVGGARALPAGTDDEALLLQLDHPAARWQALCDPLDIPVLSSASLLVWITRWDVDTLPQEVRDWRKSTVCLSLCNMHALAIE